MSQFIYLNNKSGYSFLRSTLKVEDLVNIGIKNEMPFLALTDFNNMFGVAEFVTLCKKNNIKPIIGMEVKLNDAFETPLVLLASSNEGYKSLCHLTSIVSNNQLTDLVTLEDLEKEKEGIICILPYIRGRLEELDYSLRENLIKTINGIFKGFYLGLEYYNFEDLRKVENARKLAENLTIRTVPIYEVLTDSYPNVQLLNVLRAIKNQTTVDNLEDVDYTNHYFLTDNKIKNVYTEKEINSTYFLASLCDVDLDKIKGELIKYPLKNDVNDFDYLKALCIKGLNKRFSNKVTKEYYDRLNYELDVINKMGFVNYFLVVYDYVKYAKQNDIFVGPGRGSGGGSLVSYSLGITNVDPIKYDLLFERFLNPERVTMPDIDVDFIDSKRNQVIDYLINKYGEDHVARIVTFSTLKPRSCIRDVAKAMGFTLGEIDDISNRLRRVKDKDITLKELAEISPAFMALVNTDPRFKESYELALKIEGLPRQSGVHAAGVVINNFSLDNVLPVYRASDGTLLTQYDMNYIEALNLLKMDILSISDLRIIDDCVKTVKEIYKKDIDINNIDYNDPNLYRILQTASTFNIFQFDKPSMTRAGSIIKPKCIDDVVVTLALGRPGPSKFIRNYVDRRDGKEKIVYPHPVLESILKSTYGIIVYQEQIMQILVKAASFTMGKADIARRAISKKDATKLKELEQDFIAGCIKNHITQQDANKIFNLIMSFAEYGFNKSHSVAYSMITLQMCYFKYYYPEIFYAVSMNVYDSKEKLEDCISEMRNAHLKMALPSINSAEMHFAVKNNQVIYALSRIDNLDSGLASIIIQERNNGVYKDFVDAIVRLSAKGLKKEDFTALINAGAFDEFKYNRTTCKENLNNVLLYADVITTYDVEGNPIFTPNATSKPIINEYKTNFFEDLKNEKEELGVYVSSFPLESYRAKAKDHGFVTIKEVNSKGKTYKVLGHIEEFKEFKTKKNDYMASIKISDETGSINVTVFPEKYTLYKSILKKGNYLQLKGYGDERDDNIQLVADQIKIINIDKEEQ